MTALVCYNIGQVVHYDIGATLGSFSNCFFFFFSWKKLHFAFISLLLDNNNRQLFAEGKVNIVE